jgi:hypothetical protein
MTTVVMVDEAEAQLREINEWWIANRRAAPSLVVDELERCVTLLESSRTLGRAFIRVRPTAPSRP